jgi:hypothetical protein
MIKTSEFIEQYKKGTVPASTLVKMAAFKDELEKAMAAGKFEAMIKKATVGTAIFEFFKKMPEAAGAAFGAKIPGAVETASAAAMSSADKVQHFTNPMMSYIMGYGVLAGSLMAFHEAVKAIEGKVISWKNDFEKPKLFAKMLILHPELNDKKELVETYYEALWHFSPVMAQNPLAAGAYIKQALQYHHVAGGPLPNSVNELSLIQKNWSQGMRTEGDTTMGAILTPFRTAVGGNSKS